MQLPTVRQNEQVAELSQQYASKVPSTLTPNHESKIQKQLKKLINRTTRKQNMMSRVNPYWIFIMDCSRFSY